MERMLDKPVGRKSICAFFNPAQLPVPKLTEECHSEMLILKSVLSNSERFLSNRGKKDFRGK